MTGLLVVTVAALVALAAALKLGRPLIRKLIWRLRNRLIVAYVFIALIPILLLLVLGNVGSRYLGEQISVHLVHAELERRMRLLERSAQSIVRAAPEVRPAVTSRTESLLQQAFPGVQILISEAETSHAAGNGIAVRGGRLYAWGRAVDGRTVATIAAPLTRGWLGGLIPGIGDVGMLGEQGSIRLHETEDGEAPLAPPAANRFDHELLWGTYLPVSDWEAQDRKSQVLLTVRSRLSKVADIVFTQRTASPLPDFLKFWAGVFVVVQVASIVIGVSLSRTITSAVNELYEGTRHVTAGDFSYRIRECGSDQLAGLSQSFNQMTAHLEELVQVAKEKERIEAEIEIARQVQSQLFPKSMPEPRGLRLHGVCVPARSVSGDYYDCQPLGGARIAIALGDVAGKGISAALLMASLQSGLRSQIQDAANWPGSILHPATVISRLNQQLHANTSPEKYATFFFAIYDDESGQLTYANAGHLPPLLVRNGVVSKLEVTGTVVGAFAQARYEERAIRLESGDLLAVFSDGLPEPENEFGEMFGDKRLEALLSQSGSAELTQLSTDVIAEVRKFTGSSELTDDLTLLVARRL
ncbi:MAG: HAMP domain-containing protein [Acidobacteria bacterium]|nr:HAMP domain-containing protein [Acidobacteriota bacterium]